MPGNYTDVSLIDDGEPVNSAPVAAAINALDDHLKTVTDDLAAVVAAPVITASASGAFSAETTFSAALTSALVSPPDIGATTPAAGNFDELALKTTGIALLAISGAAVNARGVRFQTLLSDRWQLYAAGSESGGNTGSDLSFVRYGDTGTIIGAALTITRSSGAVAITGALSKGSGSFKITHPLDPNFWLYHSFIEGPRCDLIYRGEVALVDGYAEVDLNAEARMRPGTFEALTQNPQVFLQNNTGWEPVRGFVKNGMLFIECKDAASTDTVGWMVVAERADSLIKQWELTDEDGRLIPEHPKTDEEKQQSSQPYEGLPLVSYGVNDDGQVVLGPEKGDA